jgi:hypothetical protein
VFESVNWHIVVPGGICKLADPILADVETLAVSLLFVLLCVSVMSPPFFVTGPFPVTFCPVLRQKR